MKTQFKICDDPDFMGRWQVRIITCSGNWYLGSWAYKPSASEVQEAWKMNRKSFIR